MIENALDNILTKLAERDYWDIEVLWNRFGVELPILEWLDSQGLIELRKVSLYQDTNTTERTKLKPWYSPTSTSESWWKYFPRTSSDSKQRKPWRTVLPDSKVKIFDLFKNSPVELRVSVAGRKMLTHRVAMSAQRKLMQVNDAQLHASISSVDAMQRELIQNQTGSAISNTVTKKRKRKASLIKQARNMTKIELNTLTTVGKHSGNYAAAAKELGKDPSTVRINHSRALKKSGRQNPQSRSVGAKALSINARGQQDI